MEKQRKILVIEDDADLLFAYRKILTDAGFEARGARDAFEAAQSFERWRPDLIITDIVLPKMDSVEMISMFRTDPAIADIPILAITAYYEESTRALAAGARAVILKPVTADELLRIVEAHMPQDPQ
jgi:CheY-like chemotaxis protein